MKNWIETMTPADLAQLARMAMTTNASVVSVSDGAVAYIQDNPIWDRMEAEVVDLESGKIFRGFARYSDIG